MGNSSLEQNTVHLLGGGVVRPFGGVVGPRLPSSEDRSEDANFVCSSGDSDACSSSERTFVPSIPGFCLLSLLELSILDGSFVTPKTLFLDIVLVRFLSNVEEFYF